MNPLTISEVAQPTVTVAQIDDWIAANVAQIADLKETGTLRGMSKLGVKWSCEVLREQNKRMRAWRRELCKR